MRPASDGQMLLALDLLPEHVALSRAEPGNLRFDVLQDPEVKTRFFIYEAYIDDDAVLAHKKTPHYLACVAKLEALMSQPRQKRSFIGLLPEV